MKKSKVCSSKVSGNENIRESKFNQYLRVHLDKHVDFQEEIKHLKKWPLEKTHKCTSQLLPAITNENSSKRFRIDPFTLFCTIDSPNRQI